MILSKMSKFLSLEEAWFKILRRDKVLSNFDAIVDVSHLQKFYVIQCRFLYKFGTSTICLNVLSTKKDLNVIDMEDI